VQTLGLCCPSSDCLWQTKVEAGRTGSKHHEVISFFIWFIESAMSSAATRLAD